MLLPSCVQVVQGRRGANVLFKRRPCVGIVFLDRVGSARRSVGGSRATARRGGSVAVVVVIISGNAHSGKQRIAASVGESRAHFLMLAKTAHRISCFKPLPRRVHDARVKRHHVAIGVRQLDDRQAVLGERGADGGKSAGKVSVLVAKMAVFVVLRRVLDLGLGLGQRAGNLVDLF